MKINTTTQANVSQVIGETQAKKKRQALDLSLNAQLSGIKVTSTSDFTKFISTYYTVSASLYELVSKYSNTLAYYKKELEHAQAKNDSNVELLSQKCAQLQAYYKHLRRGCNARYKYTYKSVTEDTYKAYLLRVSKPQGWIKALSVQVKALGIVHESGLVSYLDKVLGSRSANIKKLVNDIVLENLSRAQFDKLFVNALLQVALCKGLVSNKIIKHTVKAVCEIDLQECNLALYPVLKDTDSVKTIKSRLKDNGFSIKQWCKDTNRTVSSLKRADYEKAYRQAVRQEYFLEY